MKIVHYIFKLPAFVCAAAVAMALSGCDKLLLEKGGGKINCRVDVTQTKGAPITTASMNSATSSGFTMRAYAEEAWHDNEKSSGTGSLSSPNPAGLYFNKAVTYSSGSWTIADSPDWINDVGIKFFCHAPTTPAGSFSITKSDTSTDDVLPFTYTVPISTGTPAGATNGNTEDLVFAYAQQKVSYDNKGTLESGSETVNLKFYHALSQIRFCVSTNDGTFSKDLRIISIVLKGAKQSDGTYPGMVASGTCVYDGGDKTFAWTDGTTRCNYTQTFGTGGADFSGISTSGGTTTGLPTGWTAGSYTKNSTTYNLYTCTGDVLFVIPQNHTNCAVDITFQKGASGTPYTVTGKLPDTDKWVAGKYYSYKIKALKTLSLTLAKGDWIDGSENLEF